MENEKRLILKSAFSVDELLKLDPEQARKHFITQFFVPVAYNKWESMNGAAYALLHLAYVGDYYLPVISFVNVQNGFLGELPNPLMILGTGSLYDAVDRQTQMRTFGRDLLIDEISKCLKHAFADSLPTEKTQFNDSCPLLASIKAKPNNKYELNVITKKRSSNAGFLNQAVDRKTTAKRSTKYGRDYNILTGEWLNLCDAEDPCPSCVVIGGSKAKNNFYDDPGAD